MLKDAPVWLIVVVLAAILIPILLKFFRRR